MARPTLRAAALTAAFTACGPADGPLDTSTAIGGAGWGDNVAITPRDGTFVYTSDGYPNHELNAEYIIPDDGTTCVPHPTAACSHVETLSLAIKAVPLDATITTTPELVDQTASMPFGSMGVMISGVAVFNPFEGDGTTVAMNANFTIDDADGVAVPFMDACNGHPSPNPVKAYHYHGLPPCVTAQVDEAGGPSHIIGIAYDGFPIYGDRDANGDPIDPADLDECNGLDSPTPEFPDGIYHYVLLEVMTEQSTVRCLHGRLAKPLAAYQYL
ncbi:MAG TPA: YHYH protein [Myxococcota bacterium]|nr:YHYH protein [Myxococcota bacterium]